jgi:S-(hydroxymethyl)glutathione dehydrogenase/alcohol dehydrogenase
VRAALLLTEDRSIVVEDVALSEIGAHDVRLRIEASGVCHSDLSIVRGRFGGSGNAAVVLGHEAAGTVTEVGPEVTRCAVGDRAIFSWWPQCGQCWYCVRGHATQCEVGATLRGSKDPHVVRGDGSQISTAGLGTFAEEMIAHEYCVVPVTTTVPTAELALIGCGVTTGVGAVLWTAKVPPGASVAVFGCGGVGQFVVQGARIAGAAEVFAVDPVPLKRETALNLGATEAIDPSACDPAERLRELTGGRGVDYAFEVVGSSELARTAFDSVRPGGTLVVVGIPPSGSSLTLPSYELLSQEKRVLGSFYGSCVARVHFPMLLNLIEHGRLDVGAAVTRQIALDELEDAFRAMEAGEVIRSVVV